MLFSLAQWMTWTLLVQVIIIPLYNSNILTFWQCNCEYSDIYFCWFNVLVIASDIIMCIASYYYYYYYYYVNRTQGTVVNIH